MVPGERPYGRLFVLGIAICFPLQAAGIVVGSAIGCALAWGLKYDKAEILAGIYGFNPALVGIATFFFFQPGAMSVGLMVAGCIVATVLTRLVRVSCRFRPTPRRLSLRPGGCS